MCIALNSYYLSVLKTGVITQAKGSAYIENGKTKVIVSVFDPREIPNKTEYSSKGELFCQFKYAPFSCSRRRQHQQDAEEKQNTAILKQALESAVCRHEFPNFQVDIYALVLENDGSAVSSAIICAGLALAHARVPMYDLITAVTLGIQNDNFLLDPRADEERICEGAVKNNQGGYFDHGVITFSMLNTHEQVSEIYQTGNLSFDNFTKCVDILTKATKDIVPLVQKCLVKYVLKHVTKDIED